MIKSGYLVDERTYRIMLRNTGDYITLDAEDFMKVKDIIWYRHLPSGIIMTKAGTPLAFYLNIVGERKELAPKDDYRRRWYA